MKNYFGRNIALGVMGVLFSLQSVADTQFRIDLSAGLVHVDGGAYKEGLVLDHGISIENILNYRFGYVVMDRIYLDDSRYDENDVEVEVKAPYIGVGKTFDIKPLKFEVGGGVMYAKTKGEYLGRVFESDYETDGYLNAKLLIPISKLISLHADAKYIDDVSGRNLNLFSFGVRFKL